MVRFFIVVFGILIVSSPILAEIKDRPIPALPQVTSSSWNILDAHTGKNIASYHHDLLLPPASLTKMMTAYIVAEDIAAGRLTLEDKVTVSENAWRKGGAKSGGSTMFLLPNSQVTVKDLLYGVIVQSGNDASITLAEHIAGSEEEFAVIMNKVAAREGMTQTYFVNATGLPEEGHVSTARDLSILGRAMIQDYPEQYKIYKNRVFKYGGISQRNRNRFLWLDSSVDGLKTGYTREADFCQTVSAKRGNTRFIITTLASESAKSRIKDAQKLFSWVFRNYRTFVLQHKDKVVQKVPLWYGNQKEVELYAVEDVAITTRVGDQKKAELVVDLMDRVKAPLKAGEKVGTVTVLHKGQEVRTVDLVVQEDIEEASWWKRLLDTVKLFFFWIFSV